MRVWLLQSGERPPIGDAGDRLYRTGLFSRALADRMHEVTWWTSTFDHVDKQHRFNVDTLVTAKSGINIRLLHACGYRSNISRARLRNHRELGRKFAILAREEKRAPDVIVASLPTIESCFEAVRYGNERGVPVLIDLRDLWPDVFLDVIPRPVRPLGKLLLLPLSRDVRAACAGATAIMGMTDAFVDWGVGKAGRGRTEWDRSFGFGFPVREPSPEAAGKAEEFWRSKGIAKENGDFIVCFFGTIGHQFELQPIIEAARTLQGGGRRFRFVLCGTGDRLEYFKSRARDCTNLIFPGWVGWVEISALMGMSSLGLAPYRDAACFIMSIGNKPAEYLSGGLPIALSLKRGTLFDLLYAKECGFSYRENANELVQELCSLYDNSPRLGRLATNAKRLFDEQFEADSVYGKMVEHVQNVSEAYSSGIIKRGQIRGVE